ncbi:MULTISPECIES: aldolase [Limibacillus]|jgi:ribulose-5-phosphate 4-epimerase/fuculose-1-phosphate aldolase|uniref:Ribulose-5-phosphate 4-epimerase/fuculose-1-phosphate aldolase n=1 Tax=Limibacillus halophilus TaxID=1579333 RepID=A0A839SVH3_9PROT|nr:aldolase [Limibacillus halophilus]MBB3065466.1 ribulose-5-phosphate 4-epimerase/fuculose-1-phosphate aldolase [Limibacillus halophilus]
MDSIQQARVDLAAAHRLAARYGYHEGVCNHFSYAIPDMDDRFLLSPYGVHWSQVRASDLLLVNAKGEVIEGNGYAETSAFCIHAAVHLAHPRAACVLHTHMPYATALTSLENSEILPISQNSLRFYQDVAYDNDYGGLVHDMEEGARLASNLGNKRVLMLGNHGVMVVGPTIHQAFDDLYYLERTAELQVLAYSTGKPLRLMGENLARHTKTQFDEERDRYSRIHFDGLLRILDQESPEFRN